MNVVITGASRGIGRSVAEIFAENGFNIYLCSRNEENVNNTIKELMQHHPNISVYGKAFDLTQKQQAKSFANWVLSSTSSIDVLINNAGTFVPGNISDEPDGALEQMLDINLYSAYHVTRALLPAMIKKRSGHIFNMSSIAALQAYPNGGAYSISKFALAGFSKNLRHELKPHGIKVTTVFAGAVYTDSWKGSGVSEERIMKPEDIAKTIYSVSCLSPQAVVEEIVIRPQLGDL